MLNLYRDEEQDAGRDCCFVRRRGSYIPSQIFAATGLRRYLLTLLQVAETIEEAGTHKAEVLQLEHASESKQADGGAKIEV